MYSHAFAYHAPTSIGEAVALLQAGPEGEVKLLAGGQSLLPIIKLRLAEPATLVDLGKIAELRGVHEEGDALVIGAMTTYFQVIDAPLVQRRCSLLIDVLHQVGDPQVRARGTVGGSLAHADPAGDLPATALVLNAEMHAMGPNGERRIAASQFFEDMLTTALAPDEVLTAIRFETTDTPRTGTAYLKHRHPASGYAVVGVAVLLRLAAEGTCQEARVAVTGAGTHAVRATATEQALANSTLDAGAIAAASAHVADGLDLMEDVYASGEYRAHLAQVYARRAIEAARERAAGHAS